MYSNLLEICVRSNPSPTYPRERFENADICIFQTFQETVGSHLKPSLPVVVMATLNQFNSNHFCGFTKQQSTCKNITIHQYTHTVASTPCPYERGLINLSKCKLNKLNCCYKNSWKLTQMLMLKSKTWISIVATENKCTQFNWYFRYMVITNQGATFYLK